MVTKDEILEKISHRDADWLLFNETFHRDGFALTISDHNNGDGRERCVTISVPRYKMFITLVGIYSSYDETRWQKIGLSEPYQHTETRYRFV